MADPVKVYVVWVRKPGTKWVPEEPTRFPAEVADLRAQARALGYESQVEERTFRGPREES